MLQQVDPDAAEKIHPNDQYGRCEHWKFSLPVVNFRAAGEDPQLSHSPVGLDVLTQVPHPPH